MSETEVYCKTLYEEECGDLEMDGYSIKLYKYGGNLPVPPVYVYISTAVVDGVEQFFSKKAVSTIEPDFVMIRRAIDLANEIRHDHPADLFSQPI